MWGISTVVANEGFRTARSTIEVLYGTAGSSVATQRTDDLVILGGRAVLISVYWMYTL